MQIIKLSQLREKVKSIKLERRKTATVVMIVLTVLLFVAAVWGLFSVQHIKKVVVKGDSPYKTREIMAAGEINYDDFLFSLDPDEAETKILEKMPYIREVKVTRYWFSKVVIKVESDKPYYYMKITEKANDCYVLSKELRVLEYKSSVDSMKDSGIVYLELPYLDIETCVLGKTVEYEADKKNAYVKETIEFFDGSDYASAITSIGLKSKFEGCYVDFYGKCRIIIGKPENLEIKMAKAYSVLEKENAKDHSGYIIIDVSDPTSPISRPVENLD